MRKRKRHVTIDLSESEYQRLCDICEGGLTKSAAIRIMIMATASDCLFVDPEKADIFNIIYDEQTGGANKYEQ